MTTVAPDPMELAATAMMAGVRCLTVTLGSRARCTSPRPASTRSSDLKQPSRTARSTSGRCARRSCRCPTMFDGPAIRPDAAMCGARRISPGCSPVKHHGRHARGARRRGAQRRATAAPPGSPIICAGSSSHNDHRHQSFRPRSTSRRSRQVLEQLAPIPLDEKVLLDARHTRWASPYGLTALLTRRADARREADARLAGVRGDRVVLGAHRILQARRGAVRAARPTHRARAQRRVRRAARDHAGGARAKTCTRSWAASSRRRSRFSSKELNIDPKATMGFAMTLSEACQNIVEHAGRGGWVAVQTYRWQKRLGRRVVVIAVCDAGVGFRQSLESAQGRRMSDRWDDGMALEEAVIRGVSRFRDPGRGQGLAGVRRYIGRWDGKLSVRSGTARIAIVPSWDEDVPLEEKLPPFPGCTDADHHTGADYRPVINHIDLSTVLRRTVCDLYSNLVTRPTGAAVRDGDREAAVRAAATARSRSSTSRTSGCSTIRAPMRSSRSCSCATPTRRAPRDAYFLFRGVQRLASRRDRDGARAPRPRDRRAGRGRHRGARRHRGRSASDARGRQCRALGRAMAVDLATRGGDRAGAGASACIDALCRAPAGDASSTAATSSWAR